MFAKLFSVAFVRNLVWHIFRATLTYTPIYFQQIAPMSDLQKYSYMRTALFWVITQRVAVLTFRDNLSIPSSRTWEI
jgi:hypothetical protein